MLKTVLLMLLQAFEAGWMEEETGVAVNKHRREEEASGCRTGKE